MPTGPNSNPSDDTVIRAAALMGSLMIGFVGSLLLIAFFWLLFAATSIDERLAAWLGLGAKTAWHFSRASGMVAYLLLTLSTVWGLLLTTKIIKESVPPVLSLAMHNILSWAAIGMTGLHMTALLFDSYYTYRIVDLLVPFIGPYRPQWVALGMIGMYLMILTSLSFSWRKRMGQKWWRRLHYLTYVAFALVTLHGFLAGTDSSNPGMRLLYLVSGLLVLALTNYRLIASDRQRNRQRR
ncbi:MAG: ferric reductase-like transmembrane domain-containing protein [Ardenticatenaceae bacterium]|nr:ferric reductase-like transmembrane domain-containing protein [Ardenticatenaceae bacterium]MCB8988192.1 ferric reductase-like transmembrane domain-containing protein [Ardenticatenaceae bacterium]